MFVYGALSSNPRYNENPSLCLLFAVGCINFGIGTFLTDTLASHVNISSGKLLEKWKLEIGMSSKLIPKELISLTRMKIKVGRWKLH